MSIQMFDALGYDYKRATFFFDLVRRSDMDAELNGEVFFMKERSRYKKINTEE